MLGRLIPNAQLMQTHPVFALEHRRIPAKRGLPRLPRYSLYWFLRVAVILSAMYGLTVYSNWRSYQDSGGYGYIYIEGTYLFVLFLGFASLAANFVLDFICILASINGISKERNTQHWHLIWLSNLRPYDVVEAKHTLAQLRVWRITSILISIRILVLMLILLQVFFVQNLFDGGSVLMDVLNEFVRNPIESLFGVLAVVILASAYILEPLWRMRTLTALGTAISARISGFANGLLTGFGVIVVVWISQNMVLGFAGGFTAQIFTLPGLYNASSEIVVILAFTVTVLILVTTLYVYYRGLQRWALLRAAKDAFRVD